MLYNGGVRQTMGKPAGEVTGSPITEGTDQGSAEALVPKTLG